MAIFNQWKDRSSKLSRNKIQCRLVEHKARFILYLRFAFRKIIYKTINATRFFSLSAQLCWKLSNSSLSLFTHLKWWKHDLGMKSANLNSSYALEKGRTFAQLSINILQLALAAWQRFFMNAIWTFMHFPLLPYLCQFNIWRTVGKWWCHWWGYCSESAVVDVWCLSTHMAHILSFQTNLADTGRWLK